MAQTKPMMDHFNAEYPPPTYQQRQQDGEAFPTDLPPRLQPVAQPRKYHSVRKCFSFSWHAYSLRHTGSKSKLWRRISMIYVMLLRLVISVLNMLFDGYGWNWVVTLTIGAILLVIGFFSFAWCFATIGEAEGTRKVLGISFGRKHFDIFIHVSSAIHTVMLILMFFVYGARGSSIWWNLMWIITIGYAWIASMPPEHPTACTYGMGASYAQRDAAQQPGQTV